MRACCVYTFFFVFVWGLTIAQEEKVRVGEELLKAIHYTYANQVPDTLVFEVDVEIYSEDVLEEKQVWKEWVMSPGTRLVKKSIISRDSIVYRNDSMHLYQYGELIYGHHQIDLLTLMTLGIYWEDPSRFIKAMEGMNFDLETFGTGMRYGRKKWVIGALIPGEGGEEIWIDQDDLVVTRMFYFNYPQQQRQQIEWEDFLAFGDFRLPLKVTISQGLDRLLIKRYRILRLNSP